MLREKMLCGVLLLLAACPLLPAAEPLLVPTPRASVLASSATNRPWLAAARSQKPVDLAARGYVETELLVRGYANSYDWAAAGSADAVVVRNANQPYATRMLVRRPQEARRFSGRVIVELLNPEQYDSAPLWGLSHEHFLRRGDVWVGLTVTPAAAATLQKFDAVRYGALAFASTEAGCAQPADAGNGLAWDVIAQAGVLLRSSSKENPLLDLNPQRLVAAGYAQGGAYIATLANALHRRLRLGNGAAVFDAYLNAAGSMVVTSIDPCSPALPAGDARRAVLPRDVPFVSVMTQSDFNRAPEMRRADSDAAGDVFRLYELAGVPQAGSFPAGVPAPADLAIVGLDFPAGDLCRQPRSDFPSGYAFNAIWQQLDELLVQKLPMVSVGRIDTDAGMAPRVDASGNVQGGWRLPQIVLPLAVYSGHSTPSQDGERARRVCEVTGSMQRFDAAKLRMLYRDRNEYLRRFNAAVDEAVLARLLVKEDADALKAPATRVLPAF